MKVRDRMTHDVETVRPEDDVSTALQLMLWAGIRHLPVVADGAVVGVLSHRDCIGAQPRAPDMRAKVRDVMRTDFQTAGPDDEIAAVAWRMGAFRIGCMPVLENGKLIGIFTTTDALAHLGLSAGGAA